MANHLLHTFVQRPLSRLALFLTAFAFAAPAHADHGFDPTQEISSDPLDNITTDRVMFNAGSVVKVYVDYNSFTANHFPNSFTKGNLELAVNHVISNYREYGNFNLTLKWGGFTDQFPSHGTFPARNEILINAADAYPGALPTSAFTDWPGLGKILPQLMRITFYRNYLDSITAEPDPDDSTRSNVTRTFKTFIWVLNPLEPISSTDFQSGTAIGHFDGILMHEFGHALGLGHNFEANTGQDTPLVQRTVMYPRKVDKLITKNGTKTITTYNTPPGVPRIAPQTWTYGPFIEDYEDLQALYGGATSPNLQMRVKGPQLLGRPDSIDPANWVVGTTNYARGVDFSPSPVTAILENNFKDFFFRSAFSEAKFMYGARNSTTFIEQRSILPAKTPKTLYSVAGAGGNDNKYLAAWADIDSHVIQVARSTDGGITWAGITTPNRAKTFGAPALLRLGTTTWALFYAKTSLGVSSLTQAINTDLGKVAYQITTDNGSSWGDERILSFNGQPLRAMRGVSVAAANNATILISYTTPPGQLTTCFASYPGVNAASLAVTKVKFEGTYTSTDASIGATSNHTYLAFIDSTTPEKIWPAWKNSLASDPDWIYQTDPTQLFPRDTIYTARPSLATSISSTDVFMFDFVPKP